MGPTIIPTPSFLPAGYQLKWIDDFGALDYAADRVGTHAWYEGVWWNQNNTQSDISCRDSVLTLAWRTGMPTEVDVSSLLAWRYGYFEATMSWDAVEGVWPAFWLIPQQGATAIENGEIDVVEWQFSTPHTIYSTIHDWVGPGLKTDVRPVVPNAVPLPSGFVAGAWHRYGVLWTPGKAQFYLDGVPTISAMLPPVYDTQNYFMVLSLIIGDNWMEAAPAGIESLNVHVDSVKVWQSA